MTVIDPNKDNPNEGSFHKQKANNFWAVLSVIVVLIVSTMVVSTFKKPGQMSVIESQAMDMSAMTPPKGAMPVAIAVVQRDDVSGSVTYTGTVQAFEDEDVNTRIEGRITKITVYPGDLVRKGQLLVSLDPPNSSEYLSRFQSAKYEAQAAEHDAGIAKQEFKQKQYLLQASKESEQASAKSLEEAQANLDYWTPELKREAALLERQVISQQEYDNEIAQYKAAKAKVDQAAAQKRGALNTRLAAQADYEAAMHHIGHRYAMAQKAEAAEKSEQIIDDYRQIVAAADGVVTKRLVSPGVVVSPGTMILKIAHVKQMRIQAEVASEDIEKIKVGAPVFYKTSQGGDESQARVTSIFPAADPASRTFIVEALIDNTVDQSSMEARSGNLSSLNRFRLLPGQYVVMRIETGTKSGPSIPTSAILWKEGTPQVWKAVGGSSSGAKIYTCLMHPEIQADKPGKCPKCGMELVVKEGGSALVAQLVEIKVGPANPNKTIVLSGLNEGDKVIYAGQTDLEPGMQVIATEWGTSAPVALPKPSDIQSNRLDAASNWTAKKTLSDMTIVVSMLPIPLKADSNSLLVTLQDKSGAKISNAKITAKTAMPTMNNMAGPDLKAIQKGSEYELKADLSSGLWSVNFTVNQHGQPDQEVSFDIEVP